MYFLFARSFAPLLSPACLLGLLILAAAAARLLRRRVLAAVLFWAAVAIIVGLGVLPGGTWLALPLETRFPADPPLPQHVAGIIALGGTERLAASAAWHQPLLDDPTPILALIALGRRYPKATLVFSGGARAADDPGLSEADIVHRFLAELGVNAGRIIYENRSRNTEENAVLTHALVRPRPGDPWILVTQAISMPRAVGAFRQAGWTVIPFPAGFLTAGPRSAGLSLDVLGGVQLASVALHEWVGLLVYRLLGYSDAVLPR